MKRAAISPNAVARKLDSNLGSENQGKVLGVDSTGAVVPVEMSSGAKLYIVSGAITNTSGSYTTTINNEFITAEMKAVEMELGTPSIFGDKITVTCGAGFVTISCPSVSGTSTYKISLIKSIDDPTAVTSTEFDVLANRIGDLADLETTVKTDLVSAVNEHNDAITNVSSSSVSMDTTVVNTVNTNILQKCGKLVILNLQFNFKTSPTVGTGYTIGTIPSGYRPSSNFESYGLGAGSSWKETDLATVYINSNGTITVTERRTAQNNWVKIYVPFFTA